MLSRTSEYALRALIHLAQHPDDQPIAARHIAERTGIPQKYLAKVLGDLTRAGLLDSARGIGGGFRLIRSPNEIHLYDVVAPFEQYGQRRCPFGNTECSDQNPCQAHEAWKHVLEVHMAFLTNTTLQQVSQQILEA
ncbi:MAG: Rrf2 family transcriptional regulator [Phycisphaerales bacterium]|nr:Rrf2 family transcriptional regulator [Phycisphaerales bacterium]